MGAAGSISSKNKKQSIVSALKATYEENKTNSLPDEEMVAELLKVWESQNHISSTFHNKSHYVMSIN